MSESAPAVSEAVRVGEVLEERLRLDGLAQEEAEVLFVRAHAGGDDCRGLSGPRRRRGRRQREGW